jgi:GR25 family glycosyltransferase involved in LPS biosynthesis
VKRPRIAAGHDNNAMSSFPIYVIHYSRSPERKRFVQGELDANRLSAIFIEDNDREDLTDAIIREHYDPSPGRWRDMVAISREVLIQNGQFNVSKRDWSQGVRRKHGKRKYAYFLEFYELNATQISIAIKHLTVYERMLDAQEKFALVLEDDVIFDDKFVVAATEVLASAPPGWDFINIGEGCGLRVPERHPGALLYRMRPPRTNCAEAYFISERLARAMLARGKPFTWPIDWLMQYVMMTEDHACYWRDPPIVGHGSKVGLFHSMTDEARMINVNRSPALPAGKHAFAWRVLDRIRTTIRI